MTIRVEVIITIFFEFHLCLGFEIEMDLNVPMF